jgi:hypothetical protein
MVCVQAPDVCAPISFLLFGLLADRAAHFLALPSCSEKFAQCLQSPEPGSRAAAAFALGCRPEEGSIAHLIPTLADPSRLVRYEAMLAIGRIVKEGMAEDIDAILDALQVLESDPVARVREAASAIARQLKVQRTENTGKNDGEISFCLDLPSSLLLPLLIRSVRRPGFLEVYPKNVFREDDPQFGSVSDIL